MESNTVKAVGVWFYCARTQRYLYLLRNDTKYPDTWGLAGGKVEPGESLLVAVEQENFYQKVHPLEQVLERDVSHISSCNLSRTLPWFRASM